MLLAGGLLYLAGPFAVTMFKNVPLNNKLARDGQTAWAEYLVTGRAGTTCARWPRSRPRRCSRWRFEPHPYLP
ncbi:MAG: hypothetical protein ACREVD_14730 [Burkholderiales bacterium]